ncbi:hypothetical protein [uncultured Arcobacter sp.]|uniref:hypothetical protein n=1 Tax=uncultured Arcobacter sp. TaxID=165434 RepID=UPI0026170950|nr:hypothetical protein [uncultured Arcobacter sp.]
MNELKINGIKALETIPDISFYLFILLIGVSLILIFSFIYLLYKYFKSKNNPRKRYYKRLENLDLNNTKNAAYEITKYVKKLAKSHREIKLAEELISELEEYKYKKDVKKFDNTIYQKYELFMENVDV